MNRKGLERKLNRTLDNLEEEVKAGRMSIAGALARASLATFEFVSALDKLPENAR